MAAREIGVFPRVSSQISITEIILLLFEALKGKQSAFDNDNFCAKRKYLIPFPHY